jgi:hypothetical protein
LSLLENDVLLGEDGAPGAGADDWFVDDEDLVDDDARRRQAVASGVLVGVPDDIVDAAGGLVVTDDGDVVVDVGDLISYDVDPVGRSTGGLSLTSILNLDSVKMLTVHPMPNELGFAFRDDRERGAFYFEYFRFDRFHNVLHYRTKPKLIGVKALTFLSLFYSEQIIIILFIVILLQVHHFAIRASARRVYVGVGK